MHCEIREALLQNNGAQNVPPAGSVSAGNVLQTQVLNCPWEWGVICIRTSPTGTADEC